jgi:Fe-S-cluster containining protein
MANLGPDKERELRAASRSCGTCSLCCTVLRVDELEKRAGEDCVHQCADDTHGTGCGIYETRPEICRAYQCLWRQGGLEEDERPDATGGIVDLETVGVGLRLGIRMRRLEDFDAASKLRRIAERYRSEMPVRITDVEDVMNPDRPFRVLLPEGEEHRVFGERIEVHRAGVLVEEKVVPWAERWVRAVLIWWRNRTLR